MLRRLLLLIVLLAVGGAGIAWYLSEPASVSAASLPSYSPNTDNGRTMFLAGGCSSCHATPGDSDPTRLGGGLAIKSPFGTFYAPNISSDPNDGIGRWTEAQFVTAMQKGTSPEGEHLFPAFPYPSYQRMRVQDMRDLFAFMKTLPAVQSTDRDHDLPFPFNVRRGVGLWKLLYASNPTWTNDPSQSAQWNRGAYLVNGPGHCAECHSPRNLIGGIDASRRFAGGPSPDGQGSIPNITQKALGDWSEQDFASFLETGDTPSFDSVSGEMKKVIENLKQLSAEDRAAMAHYLKSLKPI